MANCSSWASRSPSRLSPSTWYVDVTAIAGLEDLSPQSWAGHRFRRYVRRADHWLQASLWIGHYPCPCRELRPAVLMMKSTEDRPSNKLAEPLDRPTGRRIFAQGQVCSAFVVIAGIGRKNSAQMALAEDDGMIEALPADRADQSLRMPV